MEDKHKDLKSTKQRKVLDSLMSKLSAQNPSFYYLSTVEVANELHASIQARAGLSADDFELVRALSAHDIQILLSIHH